MWFHGEHQNWKTSKRYLELGAGYKHDQFLQKTKSIRQQNNDIYQYGMWYTSVK